MSIDEPWSSLDPTDLTILETLDDIVDERGWTSERVLAEELRQLGARIETIELQDRLRRLEAVDFVDTRGSLLGLGGDGWDLLHLGILHDPIND